MDANRIKKVLYEHWNCIPWAICGITVIFDGHINMLQFIVLWLYGLWLTWRKLPVTEYSKRSEEFMRKDMFKGAVVDKDGVPYKAGVETMCEMCGGYGPACERCVHDKSSEEDRRDERNG